MGEERVPWHRSFGLWEAYFAVVGLGVGGVLLGVGEVGAAGVLAALAAWYLAYGRRLAAVDDRGPHGVVFQVGVFALYLAGIALASLFSFVLFALCPLAFMTLALHRAVAAVVVFNAALPVQQLLAGVEPGAVLRGPVPIAAVVVVFSVVIGVWTESVERQSAERAALVASLRASQDEVARLSHDAGVAAERQRLAADIHDTIAQGLSSVIMLIQAAQADPPAAGRHLDLALTTARDNLAEARALVAALAPAGLDGTPLPEALDRLTARSAVPATLTVTGTARPLPTSVDVVLLRAAQEALTNVRKHAGASRVMVTLSYLDGRVALAVADDGAGFAAGGDGYGLAAMRGRVGQIAGTLTVDTAPGAGTTLRVEVPTT